MEPAAPVRNEVSVLATMPWFISVLLDDCTRSQFLEFRIAGPYPDRDHTHCFSYVQHNA